MDSLASRLPYQGGKCVYISNGYWLWMIFTKYGTGIRGNGTHYAHLNKQRYPPQHLPKSADLFTEDTPHIFLLEYIFGLYELTHRVDRVLDFFSSRPNWDSPTPSPAGECVPPPLVPLEGGGGHSLAEQGVGESQFGQGNRRLWYSRYSICTVWAYPSRAG